MKFEGFHHIGLACTDAKKSLEFYKALGCKEIFSFPKSDDGKTIYLVDFGGNAVVELIPKQDAPFETSPRWVHIAVRTDDARAAYELALKAGAKAKTPPKDVLLGTMPARNCFVQGPDQEDIEFFQVL